jgi:hypothetical protein
MGGKNSKRARERSAAFKAWRASVEKDAAEREAQFEASFPSHRASYDAGFDAGYKSRDMQFAIQEVAIAKLTAKAFGYVNRMAKEPPWQPHSEPRRGREWRKIRHRTPYILDASSPNGWRRVKGQAKREDYVAKMPPKVCEACGHLFVTGRRDAKTCSPRCRVALHRKLKHG